MYELNWAWYGGLLVLGGLGGYVADPAGMQQASEAQMANMRAAMNAGARQGWAPPEPSREEEAQKVRDAASAYASVPDFAFWYWLCGLVAFAAIHWMWHH